jgi:hypothetical protein
MDVVREEVARVLPDPVVKRIPVVEIVDVVRSVETVRFDPDSVIPDNVEKNSVDPIKEDTETVLPIMDEKVIV